MTTAPQPAEQRVSLASIQVMRGFAAIAVAIYHTHLILSQPRYGAIDVLGWVAGKGWTGVNFFFILSGFIIPYAHHADIGRPARAGRYIARRFTRVYPIYWIFLTLFIVTAAVGIGSADFSRSPANIAGAYLLAQIVAVPTLPLKVAWTLFYEVFFYAMFLLLILNRRIGTAIIAVWALAVVSWGLILGHDTSYWYLHSWNLYFAMGGIGYLAYRRFEGARGLPVLLAGLALLAGMIAAGLVDQPLGIAQTQPRTLLALGPPFVLILVGGALIDRRARWRPAAILVLLGEASYAIYLVHSPVISAMAQINRKLARHIVVEPHLLYLIVAVLAIGAGVVAHCAVERPLLRAIRRRGERRATPPSSSPPSLQTGISPTRVPLHADLRRP